MENIQIQDGSNDHKYFTVIPNYILNHSTHWDREVYIQMKKIAGDNGTCFKSIPNLMKQCGVSKERLKNSIAYLTEHKWITFIGKRPIGTKGGKQFVNEYRVNDIWKMNSDFYNKGGSPDSTPASKGGSPDDAKGGRQIVKGGSPDDQEEEPMNNIPIEEEPISGEVPAETKDEIAELIYEFREVNPSYKNYFNNTTQRSAARRLIEIHGLEKLKEVIAILPQTNAIPYAPVITTPVQLENKFAELIAFCQRQKIKKISAAPAIAKIR